MCRESAPNPALRGKRLHTLTLSDGTYETVAVDHRGQPCDVLSGTPYAVTLRDYGATLAPRAAARCRGVLAAWDAEQKTR